MDRNVSCGDANAVPDDVALDVVRALERGRLDVLVAAHEDAAASQFRRFASNPRLRTFQRTSYGFGTSVATVLNVTWHPGGTRFPRARRAARRPRRLYNPGSLTTAST